MLAVVRLSRPVVPLLVTACFSCDPIASRPTEATTLPESVTAEHDASSTEDAGPPQDAGTSEDAGVPSDGGADGGLSSLSYANDIRPFWNQYCLTCHYGHAIMGPAGRSAPVTQTMVCGTEVNAAITLPLVQPGRPEESALWIKLGTNLLMTQPVQCNREMPAQGTALKWLDPVAFEKVERWIREGALDN